MWLWTQTELSNFSNLLPGNALLLGPRVLPFLKCLCGFLDQKERCYCQRKSCCEIVTWKPMEMLPSYWNVTTLKSEVPSAETRLKTFCSVATYETVITWPSSLNYVFHSVMNIDSECTWRYKNNVKYINFAKSYNLDLFIKLKIRSICEIFFGCLSSKPRIFAWHHHA